MTPAVFLDKDGTLVPNIPYNVDPTRMSLVEGAGPALRALSAAGYRLVVVTNQAGVARGYFPEAALGAVRDRLVALLAAEGVQLSGFYWCPHHVNGVVPAYTRACDCRKPGPGLLRRAADDLGLDRGRSWMIGDQRSDVDAGHAAGCRAVLLGDTGAAPLTAPDLRAAAALILEASP